MMRCTTALPISRLLSATAQLRVWIVSGKLLPLDIEELGGWPQWCDTAVEMLLKEEGGGGQTGYSGTAGGRRRWAPNAFLFCHDFVDLLELCTNSCTVRDTMTPSGRARPNRRCVTSIE
jgi:hypothetical protein